MAKFQLNTRSLAASTSIAPERVRIGSLSLFALIIVMCLAVLAVLALTTANASLAMSQRQAVATTELYLDEQAAQEFLAGVDGVLASLRGTSASGEASPTIELVRDERGNALHDQYGYVVVNEGSRGSGAATETAAGQSGAAQGAEAVAASLVALRDAAQASVDGKVEVTAVVVGDKVNAQFACANGRVLDIVVTIRDNATYRIDRWKMSAVQNEEEPMGQLLIID